MTNSVPTLLLISDGVFSDKHFGFNKTLYNIFSSYQEEKLLFLSPEGCKAYAGDITPRFTKKLTYFPEQIIKELRNRLGLIINPIIRYFNLSLANYSSYYRSDILSCTKAEVIIICPNNIYNLVAANAILAHKTPEQKVFVFLMDDILDSNNKIFAGGSVFKSVKKLYNQSNGCFFISKALANQVFKEYGIPEKRYMVLHNPINVNEIIQNSPVRKYLKTISIAYAGSVLELHLDAILTFIKALDLIRDYKVTLVIYSHPYFFEKIKEHTSSSNILYGGLLSQKELYYNLNQHDYLLCASAFKTKVKKMISTSVFTKITDYMVANRPVIAIGPTYSANNIFVAENDLGFIIDQNLESEVKSILIEIFQNEVSYLRYVEKYPVFLKTKYNREKVIKDLVQFVTEE